MLKLQIRCRHAKELFQSSSFGEADCFCWKDYAVILIQMTNCKTNLLMSTCLCLFSQWAVVTVVSLVAVQPDM